MLMSVGEDDPLEQILQGSHDQPAGSGNASHKAAASSSLRRPPAVVFIAPLTVEQSLQPLPLVFVNPGALLFLSLTYLIRAVVV